MLHLMLDEMMLVSCTSRWTYTHRVAQVEIESWNPGILERRGRNARALLKLWVSRSGWELVVEARLIIIIIIIITYPMLSRTLGIMGR
jgi:hypothetical protein